jgi:anti-sigma factor RsiW
MGDPNFKDLINEYYSEKGLTTEQLDKLHNMQKKAELKKSFFFKGARFSSLASMASVATIVIALFYFSPFSQRSISDEVVYNHLKQMPVEVKSRDFKVIQSHLEKLDFSLVATKQIDLKRFELVGARYCSIQGHIAAQLKYRDLKTGKMTTVYQVPNRKYREINEFNKGIKVKSWTEKGVFLIHALE